MKSKKKTHTSIDRPDPTDWNELKFEIKINGLLLSDKFTYGSERITQRSLKHTALENLSTSIIMPKHHLLIIHNYNHLSSFFSTIRCSASASHLRFRLMEIEHWNIHNTHTHSRFTISIINLFDKQLILFVLDILWNTFSTKENAQLETKMPTSYKQQPILSNETHDLFHKNRKSNTAVRRSY